MNQIAEYQYILNTFCTADSRLCEVHTNFYDLEILRHLVLDLTDVQIAMVGTYFVTFEQSNEPMFAYTWSVW